MKITRAQLRQVCEVLGLDPAEVVRIRLDHSGGHAIVRHTDEDGHIHVHPHHHDELCTREVPLEVDEEMPCPA